MSTGAARGCGRGRGRGRGVGPRGCWDGSIGRSNVSLRGRGANGNRGRGRGGWDPTGRGRGRGVPPAVEYQDEHFEARQPRAPSALSMAPRSGGDARISSHARFVATVLKRCPPQKLTTAITQSATAWHECWQHADGLSMEPLQDLLAALARIPFSSDLAPPTLRNIGQAVKAMLGMAKSANTDTKAAAVELVEQVFQRLVKFVWPLERQDVETALTDMLASAEDLLESRYPAHRKARERISMLFEELEKSWVIKTVNVSEIEHNALAEAPSDPDWKHPTVGWLSDWNHFQPLKLPQMKVPGGQGDGIYDSPEEYFDVTIKLWIGMTFVDGNNALLPHCTAKVSDKVCDQPLWPMFSRGSHGGRCRSKQCVQTAEFMCCNRRHELGLCSSCANERMQRLRGPASRNASTHIYDGNVVDIRHDGFIFLDKVECRRPPERPIHWKTTKRLSSPNLVGIVLLSGRDASLRTSDDIYWAKVALHGDSFDEFKCREQGKLVVELLDYQGEDRENPLLFKGVQKGTSVAIIDCQTFVPEFVPVLMALERQRQMAMPFQNGALVNLRHRNKDDISANIDDELEEKYDGADNEANEIFPMRFSRQNVSHSTVAGLIEELIDGSALDPIVQLRRDSTFRNRLLKELTQLVIPATLDSGQLESFLSALSFPVHCTQGPPGTGKSYLGVVVVRALLIIRKLWIQMSPSIGNPPILVLSYKNHAIDEFLLDLVHSEPSMGSGKYPQDFFGFRRLIRLGGGCNEPDLQPFMERNVTNSAPMVKRITQAISDSHQQQQELRDFHKRFAAIRDAQSIILNAGPASDAETQKQNRKICYEAAIAIYEVGSVILDLNTALLKQIEEDDDKSREIDEDEFDILDVVSDTFAGTKASASVKYKDIPVLYEGIRHYDKTIAVGDIFHRWICGFVPRPPCAYNIEVCEQVADNSTPFCESHRCQFQDLDEQTQCDQSVVLQKDFCLFHACRSERCLNSRLSGNELYCVDHACFICLEIDQGAAKEATDDPPRNTCELHLLCWADDADKCCTNVALPGSSYCEMHSQKNCRGITKNGRPCKSHAISLRNPYCIAHANQNPQRNVQDRLEDNLTISSSTEESELVSGHCNAKNTKGKPCGTSPLPGESYCTAHRRKSTPVSSKLSWEAETNDTRQQVPGPAPACMPTVARCQNDPADTQIEEIHRKPASPSTWQVKGSNESKAKSIHDSSSSEYGDCENIDAESSSSDSYYDFDVDCVAIGDEDDIEESEHLQHLREVDEIQNAEQDDANESEYEESDENVVDLDAFNHSEIVRKFVPIGEWDWQMDLVTRWSCVLALLEKWTPTCQGILQFSRKRLAQLKKELRLEKIKAKAKVYEGKSVIGGTITGCVARLDAIGATNPFAILVEEASEVLEPLLFSCLSSTTCKLEMIGDHLQLQPSVMSKYDFERVNKINISMFERLIRAPAWNAVPSSILSIQRRMRKNICDLTRTFYRDITDIEDHAVCSTKTIISNKLKRPSTFKGRGFNDPINLLDHCTGKGREVPGVVPHLYFWEHSGAEEHAKVGLSRINPNEAKMVCQLAKYLVQCGVPPKSIAILTPYKGQLMLMRNLLMGEYGLVEMPKPSFGFQHGKRSPSCTVSTVDRFQGDEADVVIVSLVIDGKSKTPFVKLQNRMVVLLSRARIGMYIVGNTRYFGETAHWQETFSILQEPASSDNASELDDACIPYHGARLGRELPVCCPQHRQSTMLAKYPRELKLNFCNIICQESLACTHPCGLKCHWPQINQHKSKCDVQMESPCLRHPRALKCSYVCGATNEPDISRALKAYHCDVLVELQLQCTHEQRVTCHDEELIVQGKGAWPACVERSITPYMYADCRHSMDCSCIEFHKYSAGQPPPCVVNGEYIPSCGHAVSVKCYSRMAFLANPSSFICKERVNYRLPRCNHDANVPCSVTNTLAQWSGTAAEYGIVREGQSYGPKDYPCSKKIKFIRRCKHEEEMKCEQAFDLAQTSPVCRREVMFQNPECGHDHKASCFDKASYDIMLQQVAADLSGVTEPVISVVEGDQDNIFADFGLGIRCKEMVELVRKCNHKQRISCYDARFGISVCSEIVTVKKPLCGHDISISCYMAERVLRWNPWSTKSSENAVKLLHQNGVLDDTLPYPAAIPTDLKSVFGKECQQSLLFRRTSTCGHEIRLKCNLAFKILMSEAKAPLCKVQVQKQLPSCNHQVEVDCHTDVTSMKCVEVVEKECWNFDHCHEKTVVRCSSSSAMVQCDKATEWKCSSGHSFQIMQCKRGAPLDCPLCSYDQLTKEIESIRLQLEDENIDALCTTISLPVEVSKRVVMGMDDMLDLLERKLRLLEQFKVWIDKTEDIWARPRYHLQTIPIIVVRPRKTKLGSLKRFELRDFASTHSLNGITAHEATQANVKSMVHNKGVTSVVFGVMYSLGICVDPSDIPKGGRKKDQLIRKWVRIQQDDYGYDSLLTTKKGGSQPSGNITVWSPCVMFPTYDFELSAVTVSSIVDNLPVESCISTTSRFVSFTQPWNVPTQSESSNSATVAPRVPLEYLERTKQLFAAAFPWASNTQLVYPWSGKQLCLGATTIPESAERQLSAKCAFIRKSPMGVGKAKAKKDPPLFGGVKFLENLSKRQPFVETDLFTALEQLTISKDNSEEAEHKLQSYVTAIGKSEKYCHPLIILAFARIVGRQTTSTVRPTELLDLFRELYPEAMELWMFEDEKQSLAAKSSNNAAQSHQRAADQDIQQRWDLMKENDGCQSAAMDELLLMVGLRRVKQSAIQLFKTSLAMNKMTPALRKKNMVALNFCFMGNPGTGKTTVARLFARILNDSGMRRNNNVKLCTAQKLKDDGVDKFRDTLKEAMGGVLFIDEAYELDPMNGPKGQPIVAELLTAAEDKRDDLSIILAGYEEDIQQKLYRYNDGLQSRFEEIQFDDFDEEDLRVVWDGLLRDREWTCDDKCGFIACRRLARGAGRKGFGNARAVRKTFERATQNAMNREDFTGKLEIRTVDIIGERPTKNPKLTSVLSELNDKVGWRTIKEKINELIQICDANYERELNGIDVIPVFMNRLFLGNPGTGKTTCAGIYGRVLKNLNFLSNGEVVKKTASDFVGQHVGQSQTLTNDILKLAKGKVLVIDEAYALNDNLYGKQVLDVLVEKVQGTESDDIAVLMLGYEGQMLEMLRTQNPGLARRFPMQYAFNFEDYSEAELLDIFLATCKRKNVFCPMDVSELVIRQLAMQKSQANFGNAGAVDLILKSAMAKATKRPMSSNRIELTLEDVESEQVRRKPDKASQGDEDPLRMLNSLYRVDNIKDELRRIRNTIQVAEEEGNEIPAIGHFVFRGSPGTGKTTVARVMAKILYQMGMIATDKLVETSGLNMTGEYVGQTKKRVEEQLGQARGGVLFIDEAYELGKGHFGEEAMTTLVAAMTDPTYAGMVIIIAGYPRDIDDMLNRNAGLKSRFTRFLDFQDWLTDDCLEFTMARSNLEEYRLPTDTIESLRETFNVLRSLPGFGNGRDVMRMWKQVLECRAQRVVGNPEPESVITVEDAKAAGHIVLAERKPPTSELLSRPLSVNAPMATMDDHSVPPTVLYDSNIKEATSEPEEEEEENDNEPSDVSGSKVARDPNVSDQEWEELEQAKQAYEEMLRAAQEHADLKKQEEAKRQLELFQAMQEKLRRISPCPMGFNWHKVGSGWRCAGGSHYVSDEQLQRQFTF